MFIIDRLATAFVDHGLEPNRAIDFLNPLRWARNFGITKVEGVTSVGNNRQVVTLLYSNLNLNIGFSVYCKSGLFQVNDKVQIIQASLLKNPDTLDFVIEGSFGKEIFPHQYYAHQLKFGPALTEEQMNAQLLNGLLGVIPGNLAKK